jgi:SAM-dependent methyltransferase
VDGVRATYDRIAPHFAETRSRPWPAVEEFLETAAGGLGIDVGCGNGRHAATLAARVDRALGVDLSHRLLVEAADPVATAGAAAPSGVFRGEPRSTPVPAGSVGVALHVATLHHLPDRSARVDGLDELARTLAPGGRGLVSAWSVTHDRFDREAGFDGWIDWTLPDGTTVPRFYHVYDPDGFAADLGTSDLDVERTFTEAGNCYGVVSS